MEFGFIGELFLVLFAAVAGGIVARFLRLQPLVGYIVSGVIFGSLFLHGETQVVERFAEIGIILLLFSIGVELSFKSLGRVFKVATVGAVLQIIFVAVISYLFLVAFGLPAKVSLIFSLGFSLSSTAVVVKILADRGESDTIHGKTMLGWLLIQDLAVIPIMVLLPLIAGVGEGGFLIQTLKALGTALVVVVATILLGRKIAPYLLHKVAAVNSRELLVVSAITLALGIAYLTSFFGISPALGAFLAGVIISETQENHAVFAETRPLRDLFVALFFVTLGFLVSPTILVNNLGLIIGLSFFVLLIKTLVVFILTATLGYHGKTAVSMALGLAQIGEFSFIIYSFAGKLEILDSRMTSVGIATTMITLLLTPLFYKSIVPVWRKARILTKKWPFIHKFFVGWDRKRLARKQRQKDHIIICGYGRVGKWVGKALSLEEIPFIVIDYNQTVVNKVRKEGKSVIYGDPAEPEVLEQAGVGLAKVVIVAIPDIVVQEEIITYIQSRHPSVKVISRAHLKEDVETLEVLRVDKVIQPEFEASIRIVKSILSLIGRPGDEIKKRLVNLRRSRSMTK